MSPAILTTASLELRPFSIEDLDSLHELWTDPAVKRFLFDDRTISREEALSHLYRSERCFHEKGYGLWLFSPRGEKSVAGFSGFFPSFEDVPSLIFGTRPDHWGRGYASEAVAAVLAHAFGTLGLSRVVADVDEPNAASIRVLEKLGMSRTGRRLVGGRPLLDYEIRR